MKIFNFEVRTGPGWLLTFGATVVYVFKTNPPFSEAWIAFATFFTLLTGRRLWKELRGPNGTVITTPEDTAK